MKTKLNDIWVLWVHDNSNNWLLDSYSIIYEISTIEDFWKIYNNFNLLGGLSKKNFYLMRKGITPIWEDEKHKNGGICSIKTSLSKTFSIWSELSMYIVGETLFEDEDKMLDITGISINYKNIWSIIKIWNSDNNNNIEENLPQEIKNKYNKCSIRYNKNVVEY